MTREEGIKRLVKYGETIREQVFIDAKLAVHRRRLAVAETDCSKQVEQHRVARLEKITEENLRFTEDVEACLNSMPPREKEVLWQFYVDRGFDYIGSLCEKLGVERTQVYRIKDRAVLTFCCLYTKDFY